MFDSSGGFSGVNITNDSSITSSSKIRSEEVVASILSFIIRYGLVGAILFSIYSVCT
jgi:hypothetical protein